MCSGTSQLKESLLSRLSTTKQAELDLRKLINENVVLASYGLANDKQLVKAI